MILLLKILGLKRFLSRRNPDIAVEDMSFSQLYFFPTLAVQLLKFHLDELQVDFKNLYKVEKIGDLLTDTEKKNIELKLEGIITQDPIHDAKP